MLSEEEIQRALHASRIVSVKVRNPHGPFGLEELAGVVEHITTGKGPEQSQIQRPIALPVEAWAKLDNLAQEIGKKQSQRITASEVATALVLQGLNAAEQP
jgi:hypothetical protein